LLTGFVANKSDNCTEASDRMGRKQFLITRLRLLKVFYALVGISQISVDGFNHGFKPFRKSFELCIKSRKRKLNHLRIINCPSPRAPRLVIKESHLTEHFASHEFSELNFF